MAKSFQQLADEWGIDARLAKAVAKAGWVHATAVQEKAIPMALEGKDVLVNARTGSGKTAAYLLPTLQKILSAKKRRKSRHAASIHAVILVPTRELCTQVCRVVEDLIYFCRDVLSYQGLAGETVEEQSVWLRENPDIVVATPARLRVHLDAGNFSGTESIDTIVVDEADLVLSFGHIGNTWKYAHFFHAVKGDERPVATQLLTRLWAMGKNKKKK